VVLCERGVKGFTDDRTEICLMSQPFPWFKGDALPIDRSILPTRTGRPILNSAVCVAGLAAVATGFTLRSNDCPEEVKVTGLQALLPETIPIRLLIKCEFAWTDLARKRFRRLLLQPSGTIFYQQSPPSRTSMTRRILIAGNWRNEHAEQHRAGSLAKGNSVGRHSAKSPAVEVRALARPR